MAVTLSPLGGVAGQFFDNNGAPLSGGLLYTYAAGTTTAQATYYDASGVTLNANPIVLDAGGRVPNEIWLNSGLSYKFVLKTSAGVLIGSWDNITGINSNFVNYNAQEQIQTATAGQTVFTLTGGLTYTPGTNTLQVFVDGVNQYDGSSYAYTETNSTTVTFTQGLHVGALVKFTTAVTLSAGTTTSNLVTYQPAGTGAVTTTVQAKLRQIVNRADYDTDANYNSAASALTSRNDEIIRTKGGTSDRLLSAKLGDVISVLDFGADPTGATDSTAAIDAALAAIYTSGTKGATLLFPQGTYLCKVKINGTTNNSMGENGLCISGYGAILKGVSSNSSVICVSNAVAGTSITPPVSTYANGLKIEGFTIDMTGMSNAASTYAVAIQLSYNSSINDIHIINEPSSGGGLYFGNQVYTYTVRNFNCSRVQLLGYNNSTNQTSTISFWSLVANQVKIKNCFGISFFAPVIQGSQNHFVIEDSASIDVEGGDLEGTGGYVYQFIGSTRDITSIGNTPGGYTNSTYSTGIAYNSNLSDRPPFGGQAVGTYGRVNSPGQVILTATTAQTIFQFYDTPANQATGLVAVFGDDGTNGFSDLLLCAFSHVAVVSSNTMYGTPPTRTYALSSNLLTLARSANTCQSIKAGLIEVLTSN